jgi:predicted ATPase
LVLLNELKPHPVLCIEEPENQLYPKLLEELAEEMQAYSKRGGQVFVSTHSPDFLNAAPLSSVFWLVKKLGYSSICRASDNAQIKTYVNEGDRMGNLWKEGFFEGADPR